MRAYLVGVASGIAGFYVALMFLSSSREFHGSELLASTDSGEPITYTESGGRAYGYRWTSEYHDGAWT